MKPILPIIVVILFVTALSCKKSSSDEAPGIVSEWRLTERSSISQIPNVNSEIKTEENIGFVQKIVLKADSTYIKSRTTNGQTVNITGRYSQKIIDGEISIILKYPVEYYGILDESCSETELLVFRDNLLLNYFWVACGGPYSMKYRNVK